MARWGIVRDRYGNEMSLIDQDSGRVIPIGSNGATTAAAPASPDPIPARPRPEPFDDGPGLVTQEMVGGVVVGALTSAANYWFLLIPDYNDLASSLIVGGIVGCLAWGFLASLPRVASAVNEWRRERAEWSADLDRHVETEENETVRRLAEIRLWEQQEANRHTERMQELFAKSADARVRWMETALRFQGRTDQAVVTGSARRGDPRRAEKRHWRRERLRRMLQATYSDGPGRGWAGGQPFAMKAVGRDVYAILEESGVIYRKGNHAQFDWGAGETSEEALDYVLGKAPGVLDVTWGDEPNWDA